MLRQRFSRLVRDVSRVGIRAARGAALDESLTEESMACRTRLARRHGGSLLEPATSTSVHACQLLPSQGQTDAENSLWLQL